MALQSAFVLAALIGPMRSAMLVDAAAAAPRSGSARAPTRRFGGVASRAACASLPRSRTSRCGRRWRAAVWPLVRRWPRVLTQGARLSGKTRCAPEAARLAGRGRGARAERRADREPRRHEAPQPMRRARAAARFDRLDALRGVAIVWMAAFHFSFDLNYFRLIHQNFYRDPFWTVQRACIVTLFMACVGAGQAIATAQRQSWRRFWRRWAQIAGCAVLVSSARG